MTTPGQKPGAKAKCAECGKTFAASYIKNHQRKHHGIYIRKSTAVEPTYVEFTVENNPTFNRGYVFKHLPEYVVIQEKDGSIWVASKIR